MVESKVLAGLLAGIPLAIFFMLYMLVRGNALVEVIMEDEDIAGLSKPQLRLITGASMVAAALVFGLLAGLIYRLIDSPTLFIGLAAGLAVLTSLLAVISRTPLLPDKIAMNIAVALLLGGLIPLLASS